LPLDPCACSALTMFPCGFIMSSVFPQPPSIFCQYLQHLEMEQFFPLITWELLQQCQDQISGTPMSMQKRAYILSIMCSQSVQLSRRNMYMQLKSPNLSLSCHMTVPNGTCGIAEWDIQVNPGCSVCPQKTSFWDWTRH
jgi:hypothetical protein